MKRIASKYVRYRGCLNEKRDGIKNGARYFLFRLHGISQAREFSLSENQNKKIIPLTKIARYSVSF